MSFNPADLTPLLESFDDVRCALLCKTGSEELIEQAVALGVSWIGVGWSGSGPELIALAHSKGLEYCLWPAPTRDDVDRAIAWGADGITTDFPARVIDSIG